MNLIEQLGLEKCQAIVEGAPVWASHYVPDIDKAICCHNEDHFYFRCHVALGVEHIRLSDIRTAIANYECDHDWEDISSMGDAERQLICTCCSMKKSEHFALNAQQFNGSD